MMVMMFVVFMFFVIVFTPAVAVFIMMVMMFEVLMFIMVVITGMSSGAAGWFDIVLAYFLAAAAVLSQDVLRGKTASAGTPGGATTGRS